MRIQGRVLPCSVLLAVSAYGQSITGTITGVVEDPTGARVSGAAISALNQDTNVRYPAGTTGAGLYTIPDLPLGKYTITVEANDDLVVVQRDGSIFTRDVHIGARLGPWFDVGVALRADKREAIRMKFNHPDDEVRILGEDEAVGADTDDLAFLQHFREDAAIIAPFV